MPSLDFDTFVLPAATRFGLIFYIIFALSFLGLSGYAGTRLQRSQRVLVDFWTLVLFQLAYLCAFLAVAALGGDFPVNLWLASAAVGFTGDLFHWLLLHISDHSDAAVERASAEATIVKPIVMADAPLTIALAGWGLIGVTFFQILLLIRCGFLFDPAQMEDPAYHAKIVNYVLVLPSALFLVPNLMITVAMLTSKYTTPMIRNLQLASGVATVVGNSILVFSPLYIYRDGFPRIASALPAAGTFVAGLVAIFGAVLIVPYFIGYLNHRRFAQELKSLRLKLISRAQTLPSWREGSRYRAQEAEKLKYDILKALPSLGKNALLRFFALKLMDDFALKPGNPGTEYARKSRLAILKELGDGTQFEGDPIKEIRSVRMRIQNDYRFIRPAKLYFEKVEEDPDGVAEVYPLFDNFRKLTSVLRAFVDSDTDLEYICEDLRASEPAERKGIAETKPGLALSTISLLPALYKTFEGGIHNWLVSQWR